MKIVATLLIVLALGLVITGCSKELEKQTIPTNTQTTTDTTSDLAIDDTITNPDIGTLDDIAVSEELPQ